MSTSTARAWIKRLLAADPTPPVSVTGTTVNAATTVVDTGIAVPPGHSTKLDGGLNINDIAAQTTYSKNLNASLRNFGGQAVAGAPVVGGGTGDASLAASTITFSFVSGTLHVTLTPPGGYVGTINWEVTINPTLN